MRIRIRFSKKGAVKYVGHLDMMRYFQKAIRRAGIDIKYSEGFSPHQIMSFASPLGVGMESEAEYFDIEVNSSLSSAESVQILNAQMAEGIEVLSWIALADGARNCMSAAAATDYEIRFREGHGSFPGPDDLSEQIAAFMEQDEIIAEKAVKPKGKQKKKKKNAEPVTRQIDIRPLILSFESTGTVMYARLSSASGKSLNTRVFLESFSRWLGYDYSQNDFMITRKEVYFSETAPDGGEELVPLERAGQVIKQASA